MTTQYLVGDISRLLGDLQAAMTTEVSAAEIGRLRHRAEATPPWRLAPVLARALARANQASWESLIRGDAQAFVAQCAARDELVDFGDSADLFDPQ
jgi:hypothetical protein